MKKVLLLLSIFSVFLVISCAPPRESISGKGNEGLLAIFCEPKDASVLVDNVYQGKAKQFDGRPGYLQLSPGTHNIKIEMEGYKPFRKQIYINVGKEEIKIKLRQK